MLTSKEFTQLVHAICGMANVNLVGTGVCVPQESVIKLLATYVDVKCEAKYDKPTGTWSWGFAPNG